MLAQDSAGNANGVPRGRILIVEDEWLIADDIERMLTILGYNVAGPVPRSADALALIDTLAPDAAILDIGLDGHFSFPVAEELTRRDIPFLFLSGYTVTDIPGPFRTRLLLPKPVTLEALRANMRALAA
jgi:DNA-binding response OmpR family regulator